MGLKFKVCGSCGERKMIGRSKNKCKSCRRGVVGTPVTLELPTTVPATVTATFTSTYVSRNIILMQMGYNTYREYLQSQLWKAVKSRAFTVLGRDCKICGKRAQVIHHIDYSKETLFGLTYDGLVPLCRLCHDEVENDGKNKRSFLQALEEFTHRLQELE